MVCQAAIDYARRYAASPMRWRKKNLTCREKNELLEIARVCEWVPENPARTFHEAIQCINFILVGRGLEAMLRLARQIGSIPVALF